jgi:hypothetical protein
MIFYFQTYPSDRKFLKYLVTGIWILDTLSLLFVSHSTYTWLVIDYDDPAGLNKVIWSIASEPLCSATIAFIVQTFMAYRIYILKPKLLILSIGIVAASLTAWGVGLAAVRISLTTTVGFSALNRKLHALAIIGGSLGSVLDIIIAITLVTILRAQGVGKLARTGRIVSALTLYLITTNILTSVITASAAITFFSSPKTSVYEAINILVSKAYTNAFLSQLNLRESIRGRGAIITQSANTDVKPVVFNYRPSTTEVVSNFEAALPTPITSLTPDDAFKNYS